MSPEFNALKCEREMYTLLKAFLWGLFSIKSTGDSFLKIESGNKSV